VNNRGQQQEIAMIDTPQIAQSAQQRTAAIHVTIARSEIQQVFRPAVSELTAALGEQGIGATGPLFAHYLKMPGEEFDLEVGLPVDKAVKASGRVYASELPAMKVARTIYRGPMEGLGAAWGELRSWIAANGHTGQPFAWEHYLVGPDKDPDPSKWQTELNWPLAD
jgi:effector-binding domain-containing protein